MGAISKPTGVSPIWGEIYTMVFPIHLWQVMASHWEWFMKLAANHIQWIPLAILTFYQSINSIEERFRKVHSIYHISLGIHRFRMCASFRDDPKSSLIRIPF